MPTYTRSQLLTRINAGIKQKAGMLVSQGDLANDTVREVLSEIDLRSMRRKTNLSPALFDGMFQYTCPTDLKDYKIIAVNPQTDEKAKDWDLVPFEEFKRRQSWRTIAIEDADFVRRVWLKATVDHTALVLSEFDDTGSGGGTWSALGDATNIDGDADDYVRGSASLKWDISAAGGTTAGLQNTSLNAFDISEYLEGNGHALVWVYITSTTDLTNFILRLGNSDSVYYSKTTTTQFDGTAFRNGWNLLQFSLTSLTETGSVDDAAMDYAALYMTKAVGKISELGYRYDYLVLMRGKIHELHYYSKYGWQSTSGTYLENSTADTDYLNVDTSEFNLMVAKGRELAAAEVEEEKVAIREGERYTVLKTAYERSNPSEAMLMHTTYAEFI